MITTFVLLVRTNYIIDFWSHTAFIYSQFGTSNGIGEGIELNFWCWLRVSQLWKEGVRNIFR